MSSFKKAERKQAKLKIGLQGPSGSGKTYSALLIAKGIGGKIAVIDTENRSASLYADQFDFDSCELEAPFTTDKYLKAMSEAEKAGYNVVIIDSTTHQWMGDGGLYERKTQIDSRGGNSFTNWAKFTPEHNKFLSAIVQHRTHLICTVRSKQDYAVTQNDKGKSAPQKLGLAPVQREGFEYELTLMLDVAMDHSAQSSKDRTGLFDKQTFTPSIETGIKLMEWLNGAKEETWSVNLNDRNHLKNIMGKNHWAIRDVSEFITKNFPPKTMTDQLTEEEFAKLCHTVETCPKETQK